MRFLPQEHAAFTAALQAHGVDPGSVLFVKRRGRLYVQLPGSNASTFCFFREKTTKLDEHGQWVDRTHYFVGTGKEDPCDWSMVVRSFEQWLKTH